MLARRALLGFLLLAGWVQAAPRPYDVLVQGAVDSELQPLLAALEGKRELHLHAWTFWTGRIGRHRVVVSRTEVGPMNASAATLLGIQAFRPKRIINQGTAGGTHPGVALWDIVVGERTTDYGAFKSTHADAGAGVDQARWTPLVQRLRHDPRQPPVDYPHFAGDAGLVAAARTVPYARGQVRTGNIGSAHQFNKEIDRLAWTYRTYGVDTEDMESAFSAGIAKAMNVPFVAIRIVSDNEYTHPTFERVAGQYCAEFVRDFLRRLP